MCLFVCVGGVEALFFCLLVPHQQGEAASQVERRKSHAILNATDFHVKSLTTGVIYGAKACRAGHVPLERMRVRERWRYFDGARKRQVKSRRRGLTEPERLIGQKKTIGHL